MVKAVNLTVMINITKSKTGFFSAADGLDSLAGGTGHKLLLSTHTVPSFIRSSSHTGMGHISVSCQAQG